MATKKISSILHTLTLLIICIIVPDAESIDFNFPAVFNFGDSNSDTGGLIAGMGESLNSPNGQVYFKNPSGRFCDGRLVIDFLMDAMDLPLLNAYLDSIGAPIFQRGCNFAAAGSTILPATATSVSPFSFGIQVAQFLRFKSRVLEFLTRSKKFNKYLPAKDYFGRGLYTFDIGQNDLAGAFYSKSLDQVLASFPFILVEFETGIQALYDQGARHFWVHNTGPLGCLPQNIAKFGTDPTKLDEQGCVSAHNQAAKIFNLQLHALCTKLNSQYSDANITYVDIFTIKSNLISNCSRFGFEQPIMACCGYGGAPLNYDSQISCGETKVINGTSVTAKSCTDSTEYVSWDGIHYTDAANHFIMKILASQALKSITLGRPTHVWLAQVPTLAEDVQKDGLDQEKFIEEVKPKTSNIASIEKTPKKSVSINERAEEIVDKSNKELRKKVLFEKLSSIDCKKKETKPLKSILRAGSNNNKNKNN